jgi:hypothetical protein
MAGSPNLNSQAVIGDCEAPITKRSGLSLELDMAQPRMPHVSEEDVGEIP